MPGQGICCARCWRDIGVRAVEKYQFPADQLALLEGMEIPFAIYQFIDKHVVTLALSQGFCRLFGYEDRTRIPTTSRGSRMRRSGLPRKKAPTRWSTGRR